MEYTNHLNILLEYGLWQVLIYPAHAIFNQI